LPDDARHHRTTVHAHPDRELDAGLGAEAVNLVT
jgi:hypothetical protein